LDTEGCTTATKGTFPKRILTPSMSAHVVVLFWDPRGYRRPFASPSDLDRPWLAIRPQTGESENIATAVKEALQRLCESMPDVFRLAVVNVVSCPGVFHELRLDAPAVVVYREKVVVWKRDSITGPSAERVAGELRSFLEANR